MPKPLPTATTERIITRYLQGDLISDIVRDEGCQRTTINRIARKHNLPTRDKALVNQRSAPKRKKLTDSDIATAIALYSEGLSTVNIADRFGVADTTITAYLRDNGIPIDQYGTRMKKLPIDVNKCVELYTNGVGLCDIAASFGVSQSAIASRLKRSGVVLRPKNSKIVVDNAEIRELYEQGLSIAEISSALGFSDWVVNRAVLESGVEVRRAGHPSRTENSRLLMAERLAKLGGVRIGRHEELLLRLLKERYGDVVHQYQIHPGGHRYDAFSGGYIWELDEDHHRLRRQKWRDQKYDEQAREMGLEVRRIWEEDLLVYGLERWYTT